MEKLAYVESSYNSIKIGIIIEIPITDVGSSGFRQEMQGCPKCDRWEQTNDCKSWRGGKRIPTGGEFCQHCGTARVIQERDYQAEPIPIPDIRPELIELGLEYEPFSEDLFFQTHSDHSEASYALSDDFTWIIVVEEVDSFGHRSDYAGGPLRKYNPAHIGKALSEARKKYSKFIKKYNGTIYFGSLSCAEDY